MKDKYIAILFLGIAFVFFFISVLLAFIITENQNTNACEDIGYSYHIRTNGDDYCSNNKVNLYSVTLDGFLKVKATKVNLYNYGEEK